MNKEDIANRLDILKDSIKTRANKYELDAELVLDCLLDTIEEIKEIISLKG